MADPVTIEQTSAVTPTPLHINQGRAGCPKAEDACVSLPLRVISPPDGYGGVNPHRPRFRRAAWAAVAGFAVRSAFAFSTGPAFASGTRGFYKFSNDLAVQCGLPGERAAGQTPDPAPVGWLGTP